MSGSAADPFAVLGLEQDGENWRSLYILGLLPLLLIGPGKASLDALIKRYVWVR